ncbi:Outer membrane antigenic lipoprotein B [Mannheimia varigena USDA-ARS-USMARC-1388]|uniref:peptidoglycan DD-metalloendopeptidase family protein n=1 Tax=Mannheimia varigena TaxID=85404 RepID=UPI0003E3A9FA|nr:peptidoglycan DD-metalloendopeptidase family protein [Mannheimia varigena]AHG78909.1 Outer membrane antigenic lipoprotein B [Mannheimia varigena USDA-ARS-USMARC-1388]QLD32326.1 peptidoglycan DD-metalloendopeptidase family protein [Mannheimia varigena]TLU75490.1 LysM peptidoglycan-binding domain-containing protein [Mannheimia varigena]
MKKQFILLPLVSAILAACSSNNPAPVVNASGNNELSPGVMQPVDTNMGAINSSGGWQSDIQSAPMPSSMNMPVQTIPQPVSTPQPIATVPQPVITNPVITEQPPQPTTTTKIVKKTKTVEKKVDQNFEIPRDANNAPMYNQIQKGFYDGSTYTVRKGDTMFLIAYIVGKDVKEIAALNNMSEPYQLNVGQKIKTGKSATETITVEEKVTVPVEPQITYQQGANGTTYASDGNITGPVKAGTGNTDEPITTNNGIRASAGTVSAVTASAGTASQIENRTTSTIRATTASESPSSASNTTVAPASSIKWQWPTNGRVISGFSSAEGGNKGLDIAGSKGQDVRAAAAGKVVYAGNALQGYGNLIIIKHTDDFLSAYAHNNTIDVDEQDTVKAGQKIGTLGSTGTNTNKLHFEIRYKGKSVDPVRYLPRK